MLSNKKKEERRGERWIVKFW